MSEGDRPDEARPSQGEPSPQSLTEPPLSEQEFTFSSPAADETFEMAPEALPAGTWEAAKRTDTALAPVVEEIPVDRVVELLAKVNLFAELPALFLKRIAAVGQVEEHAKDALVFAEGSSGDKLYVILSGAVRIARDVPGIGEETLAVLRPGNYFGEMALVDDFPRSADARVHETCRVFVIAKEHLEDLLFVDRDLAYDLLWNFVRTLASRLRETNDKMTMLAATSRF